MLQLNKTDDLKKHVFTIHCANVFSLLQRKTINTLIFNAYDDLLKKGEHQISIRDLCDLAGYNSNDHKPIKKALMELITTVVEWNVINETTKGITETWNASAIIADAKIEDSICTYSYSNRMKELLYRPEIYGRINMRVQSKFRSAYGLALYENCSRYQNLKNTPWLDMDIFRKLMGVPDDKYLVFRDFKRRVIESSVKEVNEHASFSVEPIVRKNGRKRTAIQFGIQHQRKAFKLNSKVLEKNSKKSDLNMVLENDFRLSEHQVEHVLSEYKELYIEEKIKLVQQSKAYQSGKINNIARYFLGALQNDYKLPCSSSDVLESKRLELEKNKNIQAQKEKQEKQIKDSYSSYESGIMDKAIANLLPEIKKQLLTEFNESIPSGQQAFVLKKLNKKGLDDPMVKGLFKHFLKENHSELFGSKKSFGDFRLEYCAKNKV